MSTIENDITEAGLTKEFAHVMKPVMQGALDYIDANYGGLVPYLNKIGFGPTYQQRLKTVATLVKD
jgi:hypothetical protein